MILPNFKLKKVNECVVLLFIPESYIQIFRNEVFLEFQFDMLYINATGEACVFDDFSVSIEKEAEIHSALST